MKPYDKLKKLEEAYLLKYGWVKKGEDQWEEPEPTGDRDTVRVLSFGHAINSERLNPGASEELEGASRAYLQESGWIELPNGRWKAPDKRNRQEGSFTKALNSQKQYDRR